VFEIWSASGADDMRERGVCVGRQEKRQASKWKLVYVPEPAEPLPGVEEVRARWLGKWALLRVASEKWVWVKVYRVTNDGDVGTADEETADHGHDGNAFNQAGNDT
jgi:hypothetical protein